MIESSLDNKGSEGDVFIRVGTTVADLSVAMHVMPSPTKKRFLIQVINFILTIET